MFLDEETACAKALRLERVREFEEQDISRRAGRSQFTQGFWTIESLLEYIRSSVGNH